MSEMDLGDVKIHYEEAGQGPFAFIYCHGLGGNGDGFVPDLGYWAKQCGRAVTWDNRGLGRSSQAAKYNMPLYAADLARLMDGLGIQKAVVHGVSWGGVVVQQFALDFPGKCAAIILDSTSSEVNFASSNGWYGQGQDAKAGKPGTREVKPEHLDSFMASARAVAGLREHPFTPRLGKIACPALVLAGGKDVTAGVGGSVILSRNLPKAKLHILENAGHGIIHQAPEEFKTLVMDFCREHGVIK